MRSPEQLLKNTETTARLLAHTRHLSRLNHALKEALPIGLVSQASVANFRGQTVILYAKSAATATKLRQLGERLINGFAKISHEFNRIEIKVQPIDMSRPSPARIFMEEKPTLSEASAEKILALACAMPENEQLAVTLRRLAGRAKRQK